MDSYQESSSVLLLRQSCCNIRLVSNDTRKVSHHHSFNILYKSARCEPLQICFAFAFFFCKIRLLGLTLNNRHHHDKYTGKISQNPLHDGRSERKLIIYVNNIWAQRFIFFIPHVYESGHVQNDFTNILIIDNEQFNIIFNNNICRTHNKSFTQFTPIFQRGS